MKTPAEDYPIMAFATPLEFEKWLANNHHQPGLWVKIAKKSTGIPTIIHDEALDIALCYGWIDGMRRGLDDMYFLQKFTKRRSRSMWSQRNVDKVAMLIAAGRMQPAGQAEIDAAKQDGRWDAAYASPKNMTMPDDFVQAVMNSPSAKQTYQTLSKTNLYAIAFRLATAKKPETRQRRFDALLTMLESGQKLY